MIDDTIIHLTTILDARAEMSGHQDRFTSVEAYEDACDEVWDAAHHDGPGPSWITREEANHIMDDAVENG